jgi:HEAT repeat protein
MFEQSPKPIESLIEQLAWDEPRLYQIAARKLVEIGAPAAVSLSRVCHGPDAFSHRAAAVLQEIGCAAVEPLLEMLRSVNTEAQIHAIHGLHLIRDARAVEPLVAMLEHPDFEVRASAANALGWLQDARAVEFLIRHLQDTNLEVCERAASALACIGDSRAVEPLVKLLDDGRWKLQVSAASALGILGDERALEPIRRHLTDPNKQVRNFVKMALASFHCKKEHPTST